MILEAVEHPWAERRKLIWLTKYPVLPYEYRGTDTSKILKHLHCYSSTHHHWVPTSNWTMEVSRQYSSQTWAASFNWWYSGPVQVVMSFIHFLRGWPGKKPQKFILRASLYMSKEGHTDYITSLNTFFYLSLLSVYNCLLPNCFEMARLVFIFFMYIL